MRSIITGAALSATLSVATLAGCTYPGVTAPLLSGDAIAPSAGGAQPGPTCPALVNGKRPDLSASEVSDGALRLDAGVPVPPAFARQAMNIVGRFESGGADPWTGVSSQERVSVGFMQWNWITGSLLSPFMRNIEDAWLAHAPEPLRPDLQTLRAAARNQAPRSAASAVIDRWTSPASGDPLVGGIRQSVKSGLSAWLGSEPMRTYQASLVDTQMRKAYALARAWRRDTAASGSPQDVDERLLASFFDLVTFNGDRAGIWIQHVRNFRATHRTRPAVIEAIAA